MTLTAILPALVPVIAFATFRFKVKSTLINSVNEKIRMANASFLEKPSIENPHLIKEVVVTELHRSIELIDMQFSKWWLFLRLSKHSIHKSWKLSLDTSIILILQREDLLKLLEIIYSAEYQQSEDRGKHFKTLHDQWQYVQDYFNTGVPLERSYA